MIGEIYGVYVITDTTLVPGRSHVEIAAAAVKGGASCVQLRDKTLPDPEFLKVAKEIRKLTLGTKTLFVVNDRVEIALECGADGIHVGQSDMAAGRVRELAGGTVFFGVSAGNIEEAARAEADGAHHIGFGPIYQTATKSDAGAATGLEALAEIKKAIKIPVVAIGGISIKNIAAVAAAGADSASVISAVVCADDMVEAVRTLAAEFERGRGKSF